MLRRAALVAATAFLLTTCGTDGQAPSSTPTVPTVAPSTNAPAETGSSSTADPNGDPDADAPRTTTTTPPLPDGDLSAVAIGVETVLELDEPVDMLVADAAEGTVWVADRTGLVVSVDLESGQVIETILDISTETEPEGERGLLGITADADWLYINYTDLAGDTNVHAFERSSVGITGLRRVVLTRDQPFGNHNGGGLRFGPDGYLYIGFGDGGSGGDPLGSGQDAFSWLGSILRIDPTPGDDDPYVIPPDNPFANGEDGLPEVFIIGARNPWRFSFDRVTGDLWIGDVGQQDFEEVTLVLAANNGGAGANLGWNLREGLHEFRGERPPNNVDPVWEYSRGSGCSVTGGYVYRGTAIPELVGSYVFGDFCTSRIWAVSVAGGEVSFRDLQVDVPGAQLAAFGEDADGELYTLSLSGPIARIVPG